MKHRLLSILLALVLVFTLFPIDSYAAKGNENGKYQAGKISCVQDGKIKRSIADLHYSFLRKCAMINAADSCSVEIIYFIGECFLTNSRTLEIVA